MLNKKCQHYRFHCKTCVLQRVGHISQKYLGTFVNGMSVGSIGIGYASFSKVTQGGRETLKYSEAASMVQFTLGSGAMLYARTSIQSKGQASCTLYLLFFYCCSSAVVSIFTPLLRIIYFGGLLGVLEAEYSAVGDNTLTHLSYDL